MVNLSGVKKSNSENPLVLGCLSGFVFLFLLTITTFIISTIIGEDRVSEGKLDLVLFSIPFLIILLFFRAMNKYLAIIIGLSGVIGITALDLWLHSKENIFREFTGVQEYASDFEVYDAVYRPGIDYIAFLCFEYDKSVLDTIILKANLKETELDIQFLNGMYPPAWWIPHALSGDIRMLKSPPGPDQCYVFHNNERVYFAYIKF